jgi:hypothetical protein
MNEEEKRGDERRREEDDGTCFANCALGTSYGAWWEGIINRILIDSHSGPVGCFDLIIVLTQRVIML